MVEATRPPSLPQTVETQSYTPISWPAVAAFGAAVVFVLTLVALGLDARLKRRPLLEPEFVAFFVAIILVLSFISRRVVRNSEGTRTGNVAVTGSVSLNLPAAAWWVAVVVGLSY